MQECGPTECLAKLGRVLCECAAHVEARSLEKATLCLARSTSLAAAAGVGPLQRLSVPMADCLARCLLRPIPAIADALIDTSEYLDRRCVRAARRSFFDLSPFPKVAIAVECPRHRLRRAGSAAMPVVPTIARVDFHSRPGGPPHLRLTVVHDDGEFLAKMSQLLADVAGELDMAFQFHYVFGQLESLDLDDLHRILKLRSGEARAIFCTLQLHRLLAVAGDDDTCFGAGPNHFDQMESVARLQQMASRSSSSCPPAGVTCEEYDLYSSPATPMSFVSPPASTPHNFQTMPPPLAGFLSAARALSPKIVVVTEQDASHNGVSFRKRFAEALGYYGALYDNLDAAAAAYRRPAAERAEVERAVLGEEIRSVLLHEGARRRERHDRLPQWAARMELAGFRNVPLSYMALRPGNDMATRCGLRGCQSREHGGCLLLCWRSCPLYSVSAWRPDRGSLSQLIGSSSSEFICANGGSVEGE
ncbi:unnamed protein product [Urochloa decumbens]|uniref:Uncharacterized protein n=1 Tax=Urochloa decumbens TaxID=240449 RepID=A0ABC8W7N6_9POAL